MAPCTQVRRHGITVLLNSISNHPLTVDTMLPSCALRVGRVVSVIRQLCYAFLLRQLGNAGGVNAALMCICLGYGLQQPTPMAAQADLHVHAASKHQVLIIPVMPVQVPAQECCPGIDQQGLPCICLS
jgi:hypothetical protein